MTPLTQDYWDSLRAHKYQILKTVGICTVLSIASFFLLPKRYKATATIALQTEYFQLPLVSGFLPETMDPQELRAKREALIHRALDQKFVADIARKFPLINHSEGGSTNNYELELLKKRFEIIPNGPSGFIVNFSAADPNVTYQVLNIFLKHLQGIMTEERRTTLLNLHGAIQDQLEVLSAGKQNVHGNTILAARPDLVKRRIVNVEREIITLQQSLSEKHPQIIALNNQLVHLQKYNKSWDGSSAIPQHQDLFAGAKVDESVKDLFDDLMKKYRYIDVVMYMDLQTKDHYLSYLDEPYVPHSPTWPKLPILLTWGIAAGFLIGAVSAFLRTPPSRQNLRENHLESISALNLKAN